jgi:hypothetical protein
MRRWKVDRTGMLLAVGTYVLSAVFGWALVGVLIAVWFGGAG